VSFNPAELNFSVCFSHLRQFSPYFFDEEGGDVAIFKRVQGHLAVCVYLFIFVYFLFSIPEIHESGYRICHNNSMHSTNES
jgi:hypothetical protein